MNSNILLLVLVNVLGTQALFYTDSKENDFPRIGKRKDLFSSDPSWSPVVNTELEMKTNQKPPAPYKRPEKQNYASLSPILYFKLFDQNDDGYISEEEFQGSWNKEVRRLIKNIYSLEK